MMPTSLSTVRPTSVPNNRLLQNETRRFQVETAKDQETGLYEAIRLHTDLKNLPKRGPQQQTSKIDLVKDDTQSKRKSPLLAILGIPLLGGVGGAATGYLFGHLATLKTKNVSDEQSIRLDGYHLAEASGGATSAKNIKREVYENGPKPTQKNPIYIYQEEGGNKTLHVEFPIFEKYDETVKEGDNEKKEAKTVQGWVKALYNQEGFVRASFHENQQAEKARYEVTRENDALQFTNNVKPDESAEAAGHEKEIAAVLKDEKSPFIWLDVRDDFKPEVDEKTYHRLVKPSKESAAVHDTAFSIPLTLDYAKVCYNVFDTVEEAKNFVHRNKTIYGAIMGSTLGLIAGIGTWMFLKHKHEKNEQSLDERHA